ncbi:MAG: NADH-quinone oxidoreductase subunit NuoE [Ignavibacteriaceae bacterium]|jgi:NADH-quinone oxidoreductase E subunit
MTFKFTVENTKRIEEAVKKYPHKNAAVMPVLYIAQEQDGWISQEVIKEVASILEMTAEEILGVVTFYSMYHTKPAGKYHLQVCTNVSCMLRGAEGIYNYIKNKLNIENGGITEDNLFSLEEVECMGSCGTAPMFAINEDFFENLSIQKVDEIIESFKNQD